MDGVEDAVRDWNTNIRLFKKAGGTEPLDQAKRITLIRMLPIDIGAYVTMHWELPAYSTYDSLLKFVNKYIKVLRNLKGMSKSPAARAAHIVEDAESPGAEAEDPYDPEHVELLDRLMATDDPAEQVEILAVMKTRGFRTPTRRQGGPRRSGPPVKTAYMPPRDRREQDDRQKSCINCGSKTHSTRECKEPERKKSERPCFGCGQIGHESRNCPNKDRSKRAVQAIMDAPAPRKPEVLAVQNAPRRPIDAARRPPAAVFAITVAPPTVASFLKPTPAKKSNKNRFQPLSDEQRTAFDLKSQSSASEELAVVPATVCVYPCHGSSFSSEVSRAPGIGDPSCGRSSNKPVKSVS